MKLMSFWSKFLIAFAITILATSGVVVGVLSGQKEQIDMGGSIKYSVPYFTVDFLNYDDTVFETQQVAYGQDAIPPSTNPVRPGYTFKSWTDYTNITQNRRVTANWIKNEAYLTTGPKWQAIVNASAVGTNAYIEQIEFVTSVPSGATLIGSVGVTDETATTVWTEDCGIFDVTAYYTSGYKILFYSPCTIYAPKDSSYLFSNSSYSDNLSRLTSISFGNFDTSKVTNMSSMFASCSALASLDVSNFNTSKVTDMSYMFAGCQTLTSLDVTSFDTSNVTSMYNMFERCRSLTSLDLSSFDMSNVSGTTPMLSDCSALAEIQTPKAIGSTAVDLPTKTNYSWFDKANEDNVYTQITSACTNKTLVLTVNKYTVSFDANGGTIPSGSDWTGSGSSATKDVTYNNAYGTLPTPTRTGYVFNGWKSTKNLVNDNIEQYGWSGNSTTVNADNGKYTFRVTPGSSSGSAWRSFYIDVSAYIGKTITISGTISTVSPNNATLSYIKVGQGNTGQYPYHIAGSSDSKTISNSGSFSHSCTIISGTSIMGICIWMNATSAGGYVDVTVENLQIEVGSEASAFESPNKIIDASTIVSTPKNHTLTASWSIGTYTVTFRPNGGSVNPATKEVTYNNAYGTLPTPTKTITGYTNVFNGWWTESSGGTQVTESTIVSIGADHILYAHWIQTPNKYTVTLDSTNETIPETSGWTISSDGKTATKEIAYNSAYGTLPTLTKAGYVFIGWWTEASDGTQVTESTTMATAKAHTLYARWAIKYSFLRKDWLSIIRNEALLPVDTSQLRGNLYLTKTIPTSSNMVSVSVGANSSTGDTAFSGESTIQDIIAYVDCSVAPYNVYLYSPVTIFAPKDSSYLFSPHSTLSTVPGFQKIYLDNFSTFFVTSMEGMFSGSTKLTNIYGLGNISVPITVSIKNIFAKCSSLVELDLSGFNLSEKYLNYDYNFLIELTSLNLLITPNSCQCSADIPLPNTYYNSANPVAGTFYDQADPSQTYTYLARRNFFIGSGKTLIRKDAPQLTVTLNPNGGSVSQTVMLVTQWRPYGTLPTPTMTKVGYDIVFLGWFTEQTGGTQVTEETIVELDSDHTLYAHWSETPKTYTITLNPGSNATVSTTTIQVTYGTKFGTLPTPTSSLSLTFLGWYTNSVGGTQITKDSVYNNIQITTLFARWASSDAKYNTTSFTASIYLLTQAEGGRRTPIFSGYTPQFNFAASGIIQGTVTLPSSTDMAMPGSTTDGVTITLKSSTVLSVGTTFSIYEGEAIVGTGIITGIVDGTLVQTDFTISFEPNLTNATVPTSSKTVKNNQTYGTLPTPTAPQFSEVIYVFNGWWTEASGGTQVTETSTVNLTENQTLYAHWIRKVLVTFNSNGGTSSQNTKWVTYRSTIGELPVPTKAPSGNLYFRFVGWFTAKTDGTQITAENVVTTPKTIYAQWEFFTKSNLARITVTLDPGEGSVSNNTLTVASGAPYGTIPNPTYPDELYTFVGWFNDSGEQITANSIVYDPNDHTLHAVWDSIQNGNSSRTISVIFDANGGMLPYGQNRAFSSTLTRFYPMPDDLDDSDILELFELEFIYTYSLEDEDYVAIINPIRPGYTFLGWFDENGNNVVLDDSSPVTVGESHVLHAEWEETGVAIYSGKNFKMRFYMLSADELGAPVSFPSSYTLKARGAQIAATLSSTALTQGNVYDNLQCTITASYDIPLNLGLIVEIYDSITQQVVGYGIVTEIVDGTFIGNAASVFVVENSTTISGLGTLGIGYVEYGSFEVDNKQVNLVGFSSSIVSSVITHLMYMNKAAQVIDASMTDTAMILRALTRDKVIEGQVIIVLK